MDDSELVTVDKRVEDGCDNVTRFSLVEALFLQDLVEELAVIDLLGKEL